MLRRRLAISLALGGLLAATGAFAAAPTDMVPDRAKAAQIQTAVAAPGPSYRIHANPYFRTTVTNWGFLGNPDRTLIDSVTLGTGDTLIAPGFEAPPHAQVDYLYVAGLWVGGIVGGDTLVSTGATEWPPTSEMHPPLAGSPLPYSDFFGDEEFKADYTDSVTDPALVQPDELDSTHQPLPVSVRQTTRLVDDADFNKGIIIEVVVRNIGAMPIHNLWLGWYVDTDTRTPSYQNSWLNDLSGHRSNAVVLDGRPVSVSAAWSASNDGDPDSASGQFDSRSATGALGLMYLGGTPFLAEESFNWWIAAFSRVYDWGPSRAPGDTNIDGGYGRMVGDKMRYRHMSNREIDYDQVYAAVDKSTEGWIPPTTSSVARAFADGYDTRFLQTRGTADLLPGDSIVAAWALVVAPNFHTDPNNFAEKFDVTAPEAYLAGLNFASLDTTLARMKILWDGQFHDAVIGAPREFAVAGWDDSTAQLQWQKRETRRILGYGIFRSLRSDSFPSEPIAVLAAGETQYTDTELLRQQTYYYIIRSLDSLGRYGPSSEILDVLPDRPMTPIPLRAIGGRGRISIGWRTPLEPDVVSHRIYRRTGSEQWSRVGETFSSSPFVDSSVSNAVVYEYLITAVSALGNESYPSPPVKGLAFAFDGPPLVIDHTLSGATSLTDKDSVAAVWQRLVGPLGGDYRDADPVTTPSFGLEVYSPHPVTLIVSDGRYAPRPETQAQLADYLYGGGITILSGRDLFNSDAITEGTIHFGPGDWPYDDFGITAAFYPRVLLSHPTRPNAEFVGAHSIDPLLPSMDVDTTRTGWGLNPALPRPGSAIPFVGYFAVDPARGKVIYTYEAQDGSASYSHGRPVGVISKVDGVHGVVLGFPLSYMVERQARTVIARLLGRLGWTRDLPGDANGDGMISAGDVVSMIVYLYGHGTIANARNGDVNGDCFVNLTDVVTLINHLITKKPVLRPGCAAL